MQVAVQLCVASTISSIICGLPVVTVVGVERWSMPLYLLLINKNRTKIAFTNLVRLVNVFLCIIAYVLKPSFAGYQFVIWKMMMMYSYHVTT